MEESEVDQALRFTVRAEVAGAAPRADAWQRLHERLQREELASQQTPGIAASFALYPQPRLSWPLQTTIMGRFSQLSAAFMLFLLLLANPHTFDRLGSAGQTLRPVQVQLQAEAEAPRPVARLVNRAEYWEAKADAAAQLDAARSQDSAEIVPHTVAPAAVPDSIPAPVRLVQARDVTDSSDGKLAIGYPLGKIYTR